MSLSLFPFLFSIPPDIVLKEVVLGFTLPLRLSFFPFLSIPHSIDLKDVI